MGARGWRTRRTSRRTLATGPVGGRRCPASTCPPWMTPGVTSDLFLLAGDVIHAQPCPHLARKAGDDTPRGRGRRGHSQGWAVCTLAVSNGNDSQSLWS